MNEIGEDIHRIMRRNMTIRDEFIAARALNASDRGNSTGVAHGDTVGRPGGGEGQTRSYLDNDFLGKNFIVLLETVLWECTV